MLSELKLNQSVSTQESIAVSTPLASQMFTAMCLLYLVITLYLLASQSDMAIRLAMLTSTPNTHY